jgi:hypothetical protein
MYFFIKKLKRFRKSLNYAKFILHSYERVSRFSFLESDLEDIVTTTKFACS